MLAGTRAWRPTAASMVMGGGGWLLRVRDGKEAAAVLDLRLRLSRVGSGGGGGGACSASLLSLLDAASESASHAVPPAPAMLVRKMPPPAGTHASSCLPTLMGITNVNGSACGGVGKASGGAVWDGGDGARRARRARRAVGGWGQGRRRGLRCGVGVADGLRQRSVHPGGVCSRAPRAPCALSVSCAAGLHRVAGVRAAHHIPRV